MNVVGNKTSETKPFENDAKIPDTALQVCMLVWLGLCLVFLCSNHHAHILHLENGKVYFVFLHVEGINFLKKIFIRGHSK